MIDIQLADGKRTRVEGFLTSVPGLAVTKTLGAGRIFGEWTITHTTTGFSLPFVFRDSFTAQHGVAAIAGLADWTQADGFRNNTKLHEDARRELVAVGGMQLKAGV